MVALLRLPPLAEEVPVHFRANRRSRKYILKVASDGSVRVTVPRFGSQRFALQFASEHASWLAEEIAKARRHGAPWQPGHEFLLYGTPTRIEIEESEGRFHAVFGTRQVALASPHDDLRAVTVRELRRIASKELPLLLAERALEMGLGEKVSRVTIRDQRSRWGSCSARGVISLNWRLIQMPRWVADSILIHELSHLRELNHSSRFWKAVAESDPQWQESESWLRRHRGLLI